MKIYNDIPIEAKQLSKEPGFGDTVHGSPITEIALAIAAHRDDKCYASGTAIIIGPNLAITARHVIYDFIREFDNIDHLPNGEIAGTFHLQLFQILNNGNSGLVWNVTRLWSSNFTDIVVLRLSPINQEALKYKWCLPGIDLIPPNIGERISCFGYSDPKINKIGSQIEWHVNPKTSVGEVKAVHNQKRDSSRLFFPCFQTNARYDGGMSGGPVFNEMGKLCGIICSNMPPYADGKDHVSYVTSLWPLMGIRIDLERMGHPRNIKYPMLELARDKLIHADGWERIVLFPDQEGIIRHAYLKPA
jgi:Trypsin-like peptidase domain